MSLEVNEKKSMSELFVEAFRIHNDIEKCDEPTNSEGSQNKIKHALELLDLVQSRVDQLNLFSDNEEIDEISPINLKYLLPPAIRGVLTSLLQTPREERKSILLQAEKHLHEFLQSCRDYAIGPLVEIDRSLKRKNVSAARNNARDLASLNAQREAKIARFKRDKELQERLKHLRSLMGDDGTVNGNGADDEVVRKYWMSVLEKWVDVSIENIENIGQEKEVLQFWENIPDKNDSPVPNPTSSKNGGHQNFILTRDQAQARVFGAGYPSLPTMTVEQYYESQVAAGCLPDQFSKPTNTSNEKEANASDEEEKLQKRREFDDWKDTHRRGEGNRKNMG